MEEEGAVETNALGGMGFLDGCTVGSGVDGVVFGLGDLSSRHSFVRKTVRLQRGKGGDEREEEDLNLGIISINQPNAIGYRPESCIK